MQRLKPIRACLQEKKYTLQQQLSSTAATVYRYARNTVSQYTISDNISAFRQGVNSFFPLKKLENLLYQSRQTRVVLMQSLRENILHYAGPVILYHGLIKPLLQTYCYEENDNLDQLANGLANLFFARCALILLVNNTSYALSVNHAADEALMERRLIKGCDCSMIEKTKANFASSLYFIANTILANSIKYVPYMGRPLSTGMLVLAQGQCIVEYDFASRGMCMPHRVEAFSKNNAYCLGVGLAFFMMMQCICSLISRFGHAESGFIEDMVFSVLLQYGIITGLLRTEPLPNLGLQKDLFRYQRSLADNVIKDTTDFIIPHFAQRDKRGSFGEKISRFYANPIVHTSLNGLLPEAVFDLQKFVKLPAISLLVEMKQPSLMKGLDRLWMVDYLPTFFMNKNTQVLLKVLVEMYNVQGCERTVAYFKELILLSVRSRQPSEEEHQYVTNKLLINEEYAKEQENTVEVTLYQDDFFKEIDRDYFERHSSPLRKHNLFQAVDKEEGDASLKVPSLTDCVQSMSYY